MRAFAVVALLAAAPAWAEDEPRFCPTRPSIGNSSCTTEPGHIQAEVSLVDWQRDDRADRRDDRILSGDFLTRVGVGTRTEIQVGWTAFGHDRSRDRPGGAIDTVDGVGDVTLAVRQHLVGEEGKPFNFGIQPFVTLPVGRYPVGAGDWGAGVQVPLSYDLGKALAVQFTGEGDAAPNQSGSGRHLAYDGILGLRYKASDQVKFYLEGELERDRDPSGQETHALAALSAAWQPTKRFQLDLLAVAGLSRTSPDIRLVFGGAALF